MNANDNINNGIDAAASAAKETVKAVQPTAKWVKVLKSTSINLATGVTIGLGFVGVVILVNKFMPHEE